ncbi:MAG: hypothetical protein JWN93_3611 [Hyphomicrobiales bacterium]|nr:hypothetical protein [Hyphomicrobiales bacterium]
MVRFVRIALAASAAALSAASADAQDVASFYKGRTFSIVVGHEPATGFDIYARTLARYIGKHIPGQPGVVTQNMVGAAGLASANWLGNVAPRDGSVIATFAHTVSVDPLLGASGGKFDPAKFNWIGNLDEVTGTCAFSPESGIEKAQDLFTKEVLVGASGAGVGGPLSQSPRALRNLLGMKIKLIQGYKGSADVRLAILRGEVHGICGIPLSTLKSEWRDDFTSGRIRPLLQLGLNKNPEIPDLPHVYDFAKTTEDRQAFDLIFGAQANGRPFAAPPETPADRVAALRQAFTSTVNDPQFRAEAEKLQLDLNPTAGEGVEKLIARFFAYPPEVVERAKAAVRQN